MVIDAEDVFVIILLAVCVTIYCGIGSVFAGLFQLTGFAWFAMVLGWPVILVMIFMMVGGLLSILRGR